MLKFKMYLLSLLSLLVLVSCSSCSHIPIKSQYKLGELINIDSMVKVESLYVIEHCTGDICNTFKMSSSSSGSAIADSVGGKYVLTTGHTCNPAMGVPFGLKNVKVTNDRVENIDGQYDFIVSRAVAQMETFVRWVKGKIAKKSDHELKNGILYLKGGDLTEELTLYKTAKIYDLKDYFKEEFYDTKKVVHLPLKYKG